MHQNDIPSSVLGLERKRKRGAIEEPSASASSSSPLVASTLNWKTDTEEKRYSTNLLDALRRVRSTSTAPPQGRAIRDAANRALAISARGRSRWSRAILSSRAIKLNSARKRCPTGFTPSNRYKNMASNVSFCSRKKPAVEQKAKVLGRLVPGCRKLPFPTLLDEASDYIAALQMQIRAMSALAQMLAGAAPPS